jgi:hypothetical protein
LLFDKQRDSREMMSAARLPSFVRFGRMLTPLNKQQSGSSIEVCELSSVAIVLTNPKVSTTPSSNGFTFTRSASVGRVQIEVG